MPMAFNGLRFRVVYAMSVIVVALVLSTGFGVWYVNHENAKWCRLLEILTDPTPKPAPGRSQEIYREIQVLERDFCG